MCKNETRPGVLREPTSAESRKSDGPFFVSGSARRVNSLHHLAVIQFRNVIIDGIALAAWPKCPCLSRLADRLTVLADALAEKSGVRA
jgi:hypothetical protein